MEEIEIPLFTRKIRHLYKELKYSPKDFSELFWNRDSGKSLASRQKAVIGNWKEKGIHKPNNFESDFPKYDIYTKFIANGKFAFNKDAFLKDSYEDFVHRVDSYIQHRSYDKEELQFEYKYIYYFDIITKEINYLTIELLEPFNHESKTKIKITPSEMYENVIPYYGTLENIDNYYYLSLGNDFEKLSFYFTINKSVINASILYGLRMGLTYDNRRLPITAKSIFTQEILQALEKDKLFLHLNESEYLVEENLYFHKSTNTELLCIDKMKQTIENLTSSTQRVKHIYDNASSNDIYFNIYYKSFQALNKITQRVSQGRTYFVSSRERSTNIFLTMITKEENASCNIVEPVFKNPSSMFHDKNNLKMQKDIELNIKLAKSGLKIHRILVIDKNYTITGYFREIVNKMIASGIKINVVEKEKIENYVGSYDFIYNATVGIAGYRNVGERKCYFKISKDPDKIKNLSDNFNKIEKESYAIEDFPNRPIYPNDKILTKLLGEWYYYFYGSMKEKDKTKIWDVMVTIKPNKEVKYIDSMTKETLLHGTLDTTFNTLQSFIKATAYKSKNLSLMIFDNKEIHKDIFKVQTIDKEHGLQSSMAIFGIFSKVELNTEEIIEALGSDANHTQLIEKRDFDKRVNDLNNRVKDRII